MLEGNRQARNHADQSHGFCFTSTRHFGCSQLQISGCPHQEGKLEPVSRL
ncbi:unnamed protein product [Linum tenue]|uniref:Uncharacterized protein n=1 Tax=Linum tenue TaxID=586396 RepID=A0AAV0HXN7_9ROSI|nr:unnamed protein product [Linum tenue]